MRKSELVSEGKGKYRVLIEEDDVTPERWLDLDVRRERPGLYEVTVDSRRFQVKAGVNPIDPEDSPSLKTYRLVDGWLAWEREPLQWAPLRSDYRDDGAWNMLNGALIGIGRQVAKDQAFDEKAREGFTPQIDTKEGLESERVESYRGHQITTRKFAEPKAFKGWRWLYQTSTPEKGIITQGEPYTTRWEAVGAAKLDIDERFPVVPRVKEGAPVDPEKLLKWLRRRLDVVESEIKIVNTFACRREIPGRAERCVDQGLRHLSLAETEFRAAVRLVEEGPR